MSTTRSIGTSTSTGTLTSSGIAPSGVSTRMVVSKLCWIGIVVLIGTCTVRWITTSVSIGMTSSMLTSNEIVESPKVRSPAIASSTPAEISGSSSTSCSWKPWICEA
jgi:hypothetical protein